MPPVCYGNPNFGSSSGQVSDIMPEWADHVAPDVAAMNVHSPEVSKNAQKSKSIGIAANLYPQQFTSFTQSSESTFKRQSTEVFSSFCTNVSESSCTKKRRQDQPYGQSLEADKSRTPQNPNQSCKMDQAEGLLDATGSDKPAQNVADVDAQIAKELQALTMEEREKVLYDLHGVAAAPQEEKEFVLSKLHCLESEVKRLIHSEATNEPPSALNIAWRQAPEYVNSLFLMFLRSDAFDVSKAALRLHRHFKMKAEIWGFDHLCRSIVVDDFSFHESKFFQKGNFQLLPVRDSRGRAILAKLGTDLVYDSYMTVVKILWYLVMIALQDVETQKHGIVLLAYNFTNDTRAHVPEVYRLLSVLSEVRRSLPVRNSASHFCIQSSAVGVLASTVALLAPYEFRARMKTHYGTREEVHLSLMSFGFPVSAIPVEANGSIKRKAHVEWLKSRRKVEKKLMGACGADCVVVVPSKHDVVFGRGKPTQTHMGNMQLNRFVETRVGEYFVSDRVRRNLIADEVIENIHATGGRFIENVDGVWTVVDPAKASKKVHHCFRNRKPVPGKKAAIL